MAEPYSGYIDPNFPNPMGDGDARIIIYGYTPSIVLAALGAGLFFVSFVVHTFQVVRYKTNWFIPMVVGTLMEVVGYAMRCLSSKKDPYRVVFFVVQYFFIVVAPVFFSASIYLCLSKLIGATPNSRSPMGIKPKTILTIFIINDVVSTILQVAGAALIGSSESARKDPKAGNDILLGGLCYQVFSFTVWLVLFAAFLLQFRRGSKSDTEDQVTTGVAIMTKRQMIFSAVVLFAALMVYLRTIFRLAETAQGVFGYLSVHEGFFAGLEFVPVVLAVGLFNAFHPGKWISAVGQPVRGDK